MRIAVLGDLCVSDKIPTTSTKFKQHLLKHDIRCANVEGSIAGDRFILRKAGPHIANSTGLVEFAKDLGINLACTGNNHFLDQGAKSASDTLNSLGVPGFGCILPPVSGSVIRLTDEYEQVVSLISGSESFHGSLNDLSLSSEPGALSLTSSRFRELLVNEIEACDIVVVLPHCGLEGASLPLPEWVQIFREFIDLGAKAVIAHHTHSVLPCETYADGKIYYGIGNCYMPDALAAGVSNGLCVSVETERGARVSLDHVGLHVSDDSVDLDDSGFRVQTSLGDWDEYLKNVERLCVDEFVSSVLPGLSDVFNGMGHRPTLKDFGRLMRTRMARSFVDSNPNVQRDRMIYLEHLFKVESNRWVIERALRALSP